MLSVVIPVYRNAETITTLVAELVRLQSRLAEPLEAIFVVDGSPDESFLLLREAVRRTGLRGELVLLSRNFGSFAAIRHGLSLASGHYCAVMSADLQEPVELVEQFFEVLGRGDVDIVLGRRRGRQDPLATRWSSGLFWWCYRRLVQPDMPSGGADVFGCTRQVRDVLLQLPDTHSSLVGQLIWIGFRRQLVDYVRQPRRAGKSAWTLRKKIDYMLNSIFSFTNLPITVLACVGSLGIVVSIVLSVIVYAAWLAGRIPIVGYTPLMLGLLFSTSAILLGLGIVGIYIWRVFENTKQRPRAIPLLRESFPAVAADEASDGSIRAPERSLREP